MEDKNLEFEDTLENPQDYPALQDTPDASTGEDEVEKLKKINSQLYARLKKIEARLKTDKVENQVPQDDGWKRKMEFIVKHRDLSPDEIEEIIAYAEGKKISYDDALNSTFVKSALDKIREQKKAEEAQIETESAKSDVEKKYTPEQLRNMSLEELEKIIPRN